jgi:CRISPR system Cascade subunit CasA
MKNDPSLRLHNLLTDPLLGIEDEGGRRSTVTLPGLLARLSRGEPTEMTAVQAHQQHAVFAFLVQLAGLAVVRSGGGPLPREENGWRNALREVARVDGSDDDAFTLVVGDLARPAFMQPPGSPDLLEQSPDETLFDILETAKNHDVKLRRSSSLRPEDWLIGLIALQTIQGYSGRFHYGIARMNGGFSSRPCITHAPSQSLADRFVRDVGLLLDGRFRLFANYGFPPAGGVGLLWSARWDGRTSLTLSSLDPFFIEVCRMVRLVIGDGGRLGALRQGSEAARIDSESAAGNTGDAWTPVSVKGHGLTVGRNGLDYRLVQELMLGSEWISGIAGAPNSSCGDTFWLGQVLVRADKKTQGYHERVVPIPPPARRWFSEPDQRARLGSRSIQWVQRAATARLKVLKPAVLTLLQGAPDKLKFDDDRADPFLARFDAKVDSVFFPLLFEHASAAPEDADLLFDQTLLRLADDILHDAFRSAPVPSARRWKAEARAESMLRGAAAKNLGVESLKKSDQAVLVQTTEPGDTTP